MNEKKNTTSFPLNIYQDAINNAKRRASVLIAALESAKNEIAQFQALCDLLIERGFKFEAETHSSDSGYISHWIRLIHGDQHIQAGEMMLALASLDCDEKNMWICDVTNRIHYSIISNHLPEFTLSVRKIVSKPNIAEVNHAEPLAA